MKNLKTKINNMESKRFFIPFKERLIVIEYYLSLKNNSVLNVSKISGFSFYKTQRIINEYFDNDCCLIIKSMLNN